MPPLKRRETHAMIRKVFARVGRVAPIDEEGDDSAVRRWRLRHRQRPGDVVARGSGPRHRAYRANQVAGGAGGKTVQVFAADAPRGQRRANPSPGAEPQTARRTRLPGIGAEELEEDPGPNPQQDVACPQSWMAAAGGERDPEAILDGAYRGTEVGNDVDEVVGGRVDHGGSGNATRRRHRGGSAGERASPLRASRRRARSGAGSVPRAPRCPGGAAYPCRRGARKMRSRG